MTDFPFDASGCCPACGDTTDSESLLCDDCTEMVRNDPRTPAQPSQSDGAEAFIAREEQKHIELMWSGRNVVTGADLDFLASLKIVYGGCCGLELNAEPRIERACIYCGERADNLGYCENMRRLMECNPSTPEGRLRDDREFLAACGIAGDTGPACGVVYIEIEMGREFVLKYKKNRNRKAVQRRRESSSRPKMGEYAV
jgi:hypothetical protein